MTASVSYLIGNQPTVTFTLTDKNGNTVDDATMTVTLEDPTGAQTSPAVTHVGQGLYSITFTLTIVGTWLARAVTSNVIAAGEVGIYCEASQL